MMGRLKIEKKREDDEWSRFAEDREQMEGYI